MQAGGDVMGIVTYEGIVDHGQIRLKTNVHLPEKTKVYIIVPDMQVEQITHIVSPRLAHPEQAVDFKLEVVEDSPNASL
jgi:hypothetical protein